MSLALEGSHMRRRDRSATHMTALAEIDDRLFKTEAIRDSSPVRTG